VRECKVACVVAGRWHGVAHLVEHECDGVFTLWGGTVDLDGGRQELMSLARNFAALQFEGGRCGWAYFAGGESRWGTAPGSDESPGSHTLLWFAGISRLGLPAPAGARPGGG
jgi:hypothetical protein